MHDPERTEAILLKCGTCDGVSPTDDRFIVGDLRLRLRPPGIAWFECEVLLSVLFRFRGADVVEDRTLRFRGYRPLAGIIVLT